MKWTIQYSEDSFNFIEKQKIHDEARQEIQKFIQKIKGENVNIDLRKLKGEWLGYYRIRKGKLRIIFTMDTENKIVFIEKVDFRGEAYK